MNTICNSQLFTNPSRQKSEKEGRDKIKILKFNTFFPHISSLKQKS